MIQRGSQEACSLLLLAPRQRISGKPQPGFWLPRLGIGALVFLSVRRADGGAVDKLGPQAVPPLRHFFAGRGHPDPHAAERVQGKRLRAWQ